ncbi:tRNA 4-thiouridine(8) synthase ThiI [Pyrococcus furiosus DSM 3638]|uniref:Probable tRNA sulfurtransferase n=4 Tax=Pyrococcus furiosus TaxID=2261 RepID=E7FHT9_PYRFU|nr:tRNA uracil 4-sulfurtransferase ThiI [Pyrococcus furiosus]AAF03222.1 putative thiamine biosynthesis protein THII [Pyrococcus furiosus]AAL81412.1 putative thiamin biosynthesis protein thiI [Pyrococcus furiosus DSM 3638]AFN04072.1 thiamine biosynthesis/tRNA modification protein ThiI [Pyrococcus furiosus COM1]QEK78929.1 tRNA 4-thiouridine(8) synthase ThiI [Pyrococcus furiosus DSM 3638]
MIIVRYGEIAIKRGKRKEFEKKLADNIEKILKRKGIPGKTKISRGRILVDAPNEATNIIAKTPGVVSVSPAEVMEYEEIPNYLKKTLMGFNPKSFKVETQRLDKTFLKTSLEINKEIGEFVVKEFGWKVDLENPELVIGIEIIDGKAYVFFEKIKGVGGLPVGTQGKVVALISGGIDSPVAAFLMLKRGAEVIALHFDQGTNAKKVVEKVVEILSDYSPEPIELIVENHFEILKPYVSVLAKLQKREWTCILCKIAMLKRAAEIAKEEGALGIVTGDSLGQVASQTLSNLFIETISVDYPIYRPLIGFDKEEIVSIAKRIGTYDAFLEYPYCECPFRPNRVITQGKITEFYFIRDELRKEGLL